MYLTEIWLEHVGPIHGCHIQLPFSGDGKPLPTVLVGSNGSGKSIALSYVADALFEFAKPAFRDFTPKDVENPNPFLRIVGATTVRAGSAYSLALLRFKEGDRSFGYCEKAGSLDSSTHTPSVKEAFADLWNWPKDGNYKSQNSDMQLIENAFVKGAFCYFPASRNEIPDWLNPKSIRSYPTHAKRGLIQGMLEKPLYIEKCSEENLGWLLDVFLDSYVDLPSLGKLVAMAGGGQQAAQAQPTREAVEIQNRILLRQTRQNVELILKEILQDSSCEFVLNLRQITPSRLAIKMGDGRLIPSLHVLSAGQSVLFNLFVTIIRYADQGDINLSMRLPDITGIVIVDEIDAHLHTSMQYDCLPKLLKLFPRVQFIISTQAPLLLLGMDKVFGAGCFRAVEMPGGLNISTERYTEFSASFDCYVRTRLFDDEIKRRVLAQQKPLVLMEGQLDPKYIRTAIGLLGENALAEGIEIEFVGLDDAKGARHGGKDGLNHFRNVCEANPWLVRRKILPLYDFETNKPSEDLGDLRIRVIPKSGGDSKARAGIENLFEPHLFETRFYKRKEKQGNYGEKTQIEEFDKESFCRWICDERRNPDDFRNFHVIIKILKEFLGNVTQTTSVVPIAESEGVLADQAVNPST